MTTPTTKGNEMEQRKATEGLPVISVDLLASARQSESFPKDWTEERMQAALRNYERFFTLAAKNPAMGLAPTRDIDEFWHLHMLHPRAYYEDCHRLAGRILDHNGGYGKNEGELPVLEKIFDQTARLWETTYGLDYGASGSYAPGLQNESPTCFNPGQKAPAIQAHCGGGNLATMTGMVNCCGDSFE